MLTGASIFKPNMRRRIFVSLLALSLLSAVVVTAWGCGGDDETSVAIKTIKAADHVRTADFPQADGRKTLAEIRREAKASEFTVEIVPAAATFVAGRENRLPFGLFDTRMQSFWGPTVAYFADRRDGPARGPVAVGAKALDVPVEYRSRTSASDYDQLGSGFFVTGIESPKVEPPARKRSVTMMTLTEFEGEIHSAQREFVLSEDDTVPSPGELVPAIKTETLADVDGVAAKIDTRVPPSEMHDISLDDALKQGKPIVLVFATPALCLSRVCTPVVDVAEQTKARIGDDAIFIHQEIYRENNPNLNYRTPVLRFGLTTEPFTFVIGPDGRVSKHFEGPFTADELEAAVKQAAVVDAP